MDYTGRWTSIQKEGSTNSTTEILDVIEVDTANGIVRAVGKNLSLNDLLSRFEKIGDPFSNEKFVIPKEMLDESFTTNKKEPTVESNLNTDVAYQKASVIDFERDFTDALKNINPERIEEILLENGFGQFNNYKNKFDSKDHELVKSIISKLTAKKTDAPTPINLSLYFNYDIFKLFDLTQNMDIDDSYVIDVITENLINNLSDGEFLTKSVHESIMVMLQVANHKDDSK